jgi:TatD DNase family protein
MELIDIGINLGHDSYDRDRDAVVARARAAGVTTLIATGASLAANPAVLALTRAWPGVVYATAGVHPHHASELDAGHRAELCALWAEPAVVAVGECGLDYHRNFSPRTDQLRAFAWQLEWGAASGKPLFLHQRAAHADFMAVLREHRASFKSGVAHCFTGTRAELEDCLALGLHIGITGWICDERRGLHLRELVRDIPADRLLLESDGPYLLPRDLKPQPAGRRNEPAFLAHIAATVAACRQESLATCAAHASAATHQLFGLGGAAAGRGAAPAHTAAVGLAS